MEIRKESRRRSRVEIMQQDLLPGWYATRSRRRLLAIAVIFGLSLLWVDVVVDWLIPRDDRSLLVSVIPPAIILVVGLPAVTLLNLATRGVVELRERDLDERQVSERLRAVALTHHITTGILITLFAMAVAVGIWQGHDYSVPWGVLVSLMIALFLTHFMLPLIISGWRLPDPPNDDG